MKHAILILCLWLSWSSAAAQFRMIGTATWTTLTDSTYAATINFQPDLTNNGYLATQVVDGFRMFTGTEQVYTINVNEMLSTFSSIVAVVTEYNGDHGIPIGQVMVYDPAGRATIPQAPYGNTGSTSQMQAAVDTYNARLVGTAGVDLSPYPTRSELADSTAAIRSDFPVGVAVIDSTRLTQDSILVYYQDGAEVGRDTIAGTGGGGGGVADNLGNHTMTQNLQTNGNWISGDGGNEGIAVDASGKVGIGTLTPSYTLDINSTDAVRLPVGTTAQQPTGATGLLRYNSDSTAFTGYYNAQWNRLVDYDFLSTNYWTKSGSDLYYNGGDALVPNGDIYATSIYAKDTDGNYRLAISGFDNNEIALNATRWNIGSLRLSASGDELSVQSQSDFYSKFTGTGRGFVFNGATFVDGNRTILRLNATVNNGASGAREHKFLDIVPTISNGGVGVGDDKTYYGVHINPTLTALGTNSYFVGVGLKNNSGYGVYQSGTANNYLAGKLGLGQTTPTAVLHLPAGTATASTSPLKFTSGTNLTTPEAGAVEWDGTNLYITQTTGPTRKTIAYVDTDDGSASDTTDGSGDVTVSHTLGSASITVTATTTGTTFYHVQVHTKTSTNFKIRFFDATGAAVTSTAVTADWIAKLQ